MKYKKRKERTIPKPGLEKRFLAPWLGESSRDLENQLLSRSSLPKGLRRTEWEMGGERRKEAMV